MGRLTSVILLAFCAVLVQGQESADTSSKSTPDSAKKKEPKKKGGFFHSLGETVRDGAKDGASDAVKENKPVVKVRTEDKTAEQIGTEVGSKMVRVNGQQNSATPGAANSGNGTASGGRDCQHVKGADGTDDVGTCVTGSTMDTVHDLKAKMGGRNAAAGTSDANAPSGAVNAKQSATDDGSCGAIPARVRAIRERRGFTVCSNGRMIKPPESK